MLLVIARGEASALARIEFVAGDLYVLVAIITWAFYSWMLARPPASMRAPRVRPGTGPSSCSCRCCSACSAPAPRPAPSSPTACAPIAWNGWVLAALLYVAVGPSIVAYRCWGLGITAGGPALAAFFGNLTPVFAALMSAALLGEPPRWYHALAFALIVAGIVASSARQRS